MKSIISLLFLCSFVFAQQPPDIEAAIDGLGLEQSCSPSSVGPLFLSSITSVTNFDFSVVTGPTQDYFDLAAVFQQNCNPPTYTPTQFGSLDLDISSPGFFYVFGGFAPLFDGNNWVAPVSLPISSVPMGTSYMLQALVVDATHPAGARLTNAMALIN